MNTHGYLEFEDIRLFYVYFSFISDQYYFPSRRMVFVENDESFCVLFILLIFLPTSCTYSPSFLCLLLIFIPF